MTISANISKIVFSRFVMTVFIVAQIAAGAILLAGIECAQAKGGGYNTPIKNGGTPLKQD